MRTPSSRGPCRSGGSAAGPPPRLHGSRVWPQHGREHDGGVGHRARHRPGEGLVEEDIARRLVGMAPRVGFNPTMPALADGPRIEPAPSVPSASGARPAATAADAPARPARRPLQVPRIAGDAGQRAGGDALVAEFRRRGLADDDGARRLEARDRDRIGPRDVLGMDVRAVRRALAGDVDQVLDRDGHAMQRPERRTGGDRGLGRPGRGHRLVAAGADIGVDRRLRPVDRVQHGLDIGHGRQRATADHRRRASRAGTAGRRTSGAGTPERIARTMPCGPLPGQ